VNTSNAVKTGLVIGDAVTVSATGLFNNKNVGTVKSITILSTYGGIDAGNYIIIQPESQTQHAVDMGVRAIGREMKRMAMGVSFTKTDLLTDDGRKKNADAQAKISKIAGMLTLEKRELQQIADRSKP
jgi:hypothetical protein